MIRKWSSIPEIIYKRSIDTCPEKFFVWKMIRKWSSIPKIIYKRSIGTCPERFFVSKMIHKWSIDTSFVFLLSQEGRIRSEGSGDTTSKAPMVWSMWWTALIVIASMMLRRSWTRCSWSRKWRMQYCWSWLTNKTCPMPWLPLKLWRSQSCKSFDIGSGSFSPRWHPLVMACMRVWTGFHGVLLLDSEALQNLNTGPIPFFRPMQPCT